ncbi:MAG TPA: site-2 protease family protein [Longimicrobiales bacterium]|nr:site-2 protease family protein [Longimicrobiales bacterium]
MPDLVDGFLFYAVFLFSTTLHEAAHAWAALKGGDPTAHEGGQVTLDPVPHIRREPFGMVVLPLISVVLMGWPLGYASAPYNVQWAARHPRRAAWMALAGPGANLGLVLVTGVLINVGVLAGVFFAPDAITFADVTSATAGAESWWGSVGYFLGAVFALNLLLFVFNLLPLPPLDGSAALVLGLPGPLVPRYQNFLWTNPHMAWIGIFLAWQFFDVVFNPVFTLAISALYPGISYS